MTRQADRRPPVSHLTDTVSLVEGRRHAADQEEVADLEFPHQPQDDGGQVDTMAEQVMD